LRAKMELMSWPQQRLLADRGKILSSGSEGGDLIRLDCDVRKSRSAVQSRQQQCLVSKAKTGDAQFGPWLLG